MFLLTDRLKRLLEHLKSANSTRVFLKDAEMVMHIRKVAEQQGRTEEQIIEDMMKAGMNLFAVQELAVQRWDSLTPREQEVVALVCLGQRNYEIAEILSIGPETVKTHLQNIFIKYNLHSRTELRTALQTWDFASWWANKHQR
jgi:LuxR family maltose regulon positive regulatory protein